MPEPSACESAVASARSLAGTPASQPNRNGVPGGSRFYAGRGATRGEGAA
jgi:hypothetical protein